MSNNPRTGTVFNVRTFGARGDGVTDDYLACQTAINYALAIGNGTVYFPFGNYKLSQTLLVRHAKGINFLGDGPDFTRLIAGAFPALTTVGYWRSITQGIMFKCSLNLTGGAYQLDGELDGSFGTQGLTYNNCYFDGSFNSTYVFTLNLLAGGAGQGSTIEWNNCVFANSKNAAGGRSIYLGGANALGNSFINCDFQGHITGVYCAVGTANFSNCTFESTYGYNQVFLNGWDIDNSAGSGSDDTKQIIGCRSESLALYIGGGSGVNIEGFTQSQSAALSWTANNPFYTVPGTGAFNCVRGQTAAGNVKLYIVSVAGQTGGVEPVWPESGNVVDNTVTWTQADFYCMKNVAGTVTGGQLQLGIVNSFSEGGTFTEFKHVLFTRNDPAVADFTIGGSDRPGIVFTACATGGAPPPANSGQALKNAAAFSGTPNSNVQANIVIGGWSVVQAKAVQVTHAGDTAEFTLATLTLPDNTMGPNGIVRVTAVFSCVGVAGAKELRIKLGGTAFLDNNFAANTVGGRVQTQIANRNATNSQVGSSLGVIGFAGTSTGVAVTAALDTTTNLTLLITGQLANAADTIMLESYLVEVYHGQ